MKSASNFYVFKKWNDAPAYAFGGRAKNLPESEDTVEVTSPLVPEVDKESYWAVYTEINEVAEAVRLTHENTADLFLRPKNYSRDRGARGHRPKDLWVSICFSGAEKLGYLPQIYAIASSRGLEVGFAASIAEDDYFDPIIKARNRSIIPFINAKLPQPHDDLTEEIDQKLAAQGGWHFNLKTRLTPQDDGFDQFHSLSALITHLRDGGDASGVGAICRVFDESELDVLDLRSQLGLALENFLPLLALCAPSERDEQILQAQRGVEEASSSVIFTPRTEEDGRKKIWQEVAQRQGQPDFRTALISAYGGACAISGTAVVDALHAAHLMPYNGVGTNHVTNGILLRADLHSLFDLKLIAVNPHTLCVEVSDQLLTTEYGAYHGLKIRLPVKKSERPSQHALTYNYDN